MRQLFRRLAPAAAAALLLALAACSPAASATPAASAAPSPSSSAASARPSYQTITAEQAKTLLDNESGYCLLDVREQDEYEAGHIAGATLLPLGELADRAEAELPDRDQLILVYCRSGNRSAQAAALLAQLGYTNVQDLGGILDWPYELVTD